ncbi:MAG: hypothetical protein ACLROI_03410 [Beduini sp.]|uniref:RDAC family protein n=1 Tax=Beduini sp. TaxID=1922300 RepID=UPI0011CAF26D
MSKTIDVMTLMKINQYLKEENIDCILHHASACDSRSLRIETHSDINIGEVCDKINVFLNQSWLKVEVDPYDSFHLLIK